MSDSHVGGTNNLDSFLTIARTRNANAVLLAGDLTTGHTKDYEVFQKHLTDTDSMPTFLSVGNHDLHFSGWEDYYARFGSSSYLFTIKTPVATDLFICLDTGGGTLGDKQMDWLVNILQTMRSKYRRCTVFTHNNFFRFRHAESTNPPVEELAVLIEIFTKYKVDMVITGHDHKQDAVLFGLTTYIVMDPLEDTESNAGYLQLTVKNGKTEFRFERL
jgi:DNA repair exonuclease SbcCD nuclease subunit